jgi:transcriptional antiterminator
VAKGSGKIPVFEWNEKRRKAAIALADGQTQVQAAEVCGISDRTIRQWLTYPEFTEEVDRLTLLTGIALKSERIRQAKRIVRQLEGRTKEDLLDWLKYVQSEMKADEDFIDKLAAAFHRDT